MTDTFSLFVVLSTLDVRFVRKPTGCKNAQGLRSRRLPWIWPAAGGHVTRAFDTAKPDGNRRSTSPRSRPP